MKTGLKRRIDALVLFCFYISLITCVILVMAELGLRFFVEDELQRFNKVDENDEAYSYFDWREQYFRDRKQPGGAFTYQAFSAWKRTDKNSTLINLRDGYRVSWEPEPAPDKRDFVIFMFGGSTTYCIESPDDLTIASILARKLNQPISSYRYRVKNYGVSAFVSDQELHLLTYLLQQGETPDAVVFYNGLNDINVKVGLGRRHYFDSTFRGQLFARTSLSASLHNLMTSSRLLQSIIDRPPLMKKLFPFIGDPATLRQNAVFMLDEYRENIRIIRALGQEYGFRSFHFWQPSMFNTGKQLTHAELPRADVNQDVHKLAQLANDIVGEVASEQGFFQTTPVVSINNALDNISETVFLDSAHVTPIGNEAVADAIMRSISAELGHF